MPDDKALTADELQLLEGLLARLSGPGGDLPQPLFRFVTEVTATSNVDLLVGNAAHEILLAWRDDPFGAGWHVPGSIIRHREEVAHRLAETARAEFGCTVKTADQPVALIQIFDDRGHSLSLCYQATLTGTPTRRIVTAGETPEPGDLRWFAAPPDDLYPSHRVYRDILAALDAGTLGEGARLFTQHAGRHDVAHVATGAISDDAPLV